MEKRVYRVLKKRIYEFIKNREFLFAVINVIRNRKDHQLLDRINGTSGSFFFTSGDTVTEDRQKHVYYMIDDINWGTHGFFAIFRNVLELCAVADLYGFTPYIYLDKTLYTGDGHEGSRNLYEYYFVNPVQEKRKEIRNNHNHVAADINHIFVLNRLLSNDTEELISYQGHYSQRYMDLMAETLNKHLVLRPELKLEFDEEIDHMLGMKKTIGVHYRNWTALLYGHPLPVKIQQVYQYLDIALENGFEQIFAATDDELALKRLKRRYGRRLKCYDDVIRSDDRSEVQFKQNDRQEDGYYLGKEVLRDMYTLASCDGLIAGLSQVSLFARIQRQAVKGDYDYIKIIDNGVYRKKSRSGKKYRKFVDKKAESIIDGKKQ